MEFHDDYPQYELMAHHSEEAGKKSRRVLWNVFWIMLAITLIELVIGSMAPSKGWSGTFTLKFVFISLTILKAGAIVMYFMHLGHEVKAFKYVILLPYITFIIYLLFIALTEGTYSGEARNKPKLDPILIKQQEALKAGHHGGGTSHEATEHPAEEAHH